MIQRLSLCLAVILCLHAAAAQAQTTTFDLTSMSLQDLLDVEISAASKFPQAVTRAPASITVITAEDIRRSGHRTLADVLRSVRGLSVTDDRNYSYVGVRGFARPGDYNTRVLLLVDGHRLNDPVYDQAPIGQDFPLDIEVVDRVEIIRGPGSSLYGTSAFFAVVNVITRSGRQDDRPVITTSAGTLGSAGGRASAGHVFGNGMSAVIGASLQRTGGPVEIYFPEFDSPETNGGIARNGDRERTARAYGSVSFGGLTLRAAQGDRTKRVPTAAFDSVFADPRLETRDARGYVDLNYAGALGGWRGVARASYDRYRYDGLYPFDYGDDGIQLFEDFGRADWLGGELTASRRVAPRHLVTVGSEGRYALRLSQYARELQETQVYDDRRTGTWGAYLQDEISLTSRLAVTGGLRLDRHDSFGSELSPRAAAVYNPSSASALKVMYGQAFRAPNAYELYYYPSDPDAGSLRPETIRTVEAAWEQYYGRRFRTTASVFQSSIANLISQTPDVLAFTNRDGAKSSGVEAEIEARLNGGVTARGSHVWAKATDSETGLTLSNSPAHVTKYDVVVPVRGSGLFVASSGVHTSSRLPVRGAALPGTYLQHLTLTADGLLQRLDLTLSIHNLFDKMYGDPGAEEHVQIAIPQDGRAIRAGVTVRF